MRIQAGVGTFITSLLSGSGAVGSNAETEIFQKLFVQELKYLEQGLIFQLADSNKKVALFAELVLHCYDTKALQKVVAVHAPGSREGCPFCQAIHGQHRALLRKTVHLGHR